MASEMQSITDNVIEELFAIDAIRFGEFKLKTGLLSPIYFNLRVIIGYPNLLRRISELLYETVGKSGAEFSLTCGVPYTALPLATCISLDHGIPMVIRRREAKDYGTKQMIEGVYKAGEVCLIVEDVVTSGGSVLETVKELNNVQLTVKDTVVLLDRGQGGKSRLNESGINLHSVLTMDRVLDVLLKRQKIGQKVYDQVQDFIKGNQFQPLPKKQESFKKQVLSYKERSHLVQNPVAKRLLEIMEKKQTNLCFSVDVTSAKEVLHLADKVGPYICILKTHVDILTDFNDDFINSLTELARKHEFILFEDRKFADIGNTVKNQYSHGLYTIKQWAELTNAHTVPGHGVVKGLKEASGELERACLLIAQMSSSGALTTESYIKNTVAMAKEDPQFVVGFISTSIVCDEPQFLHMTPGVNLNAGGDQLGQQYLTPEEVIKNRGCDVIIVGRGIIKAADPVDAAKQYQIAGYNSYLERLQVK